MAEKHIVKQGETLSSIAAQAGFANFHTIFDRPENAKLREERPDAHVLLPGDEVFIPDRQEKTESALTGQRNFFEADVQPLLLRIRFRDLNNRLPKQDTQFLLADRDFARQERLFPDGQGIIEKEIQPTVQKAELRTLAGTPNTVTKMDLLIGALDPVEFLSGQRARLNNLGYFAGFADLDRKQFRWAAEEFKKDKGISPLAVRDEDIDFVKGLKDPTFRQRLKKEHGS